MVIVFVVAIAIVVVEKAEEMTTAAVNMGKENNTVAVAVAVIGSEAFWEQDSCALQNFVAP